jgi:hypothetical protein
MPAELKGKISVDTQDLSRAGRAVEAFEDKLRQGFKREPGRRGVTAIEGAFGALTSGDIGGAITSVTSKFSGLGLAGGAALGIIGLGVYEAIKATRELNKTLDESEKVLARVPAQGASFEALAKNIDAVSEASIKLAKYNSVLGRAWLRGFVETGFNKKPDVAGEQAKLSDQFAKDLDAQVDKSGALANEVLLAAAGYKSMAEAAKSARESAEKLADVEEKATEMRQKVADKKLAGTQEAQELSAIDAWEAHQKEINKTTAERASQFKTLAPFLEKAQLTGKEMSAGAGLLSDRLLAKQADKATAMGDAFRQQGFTTLAAEQYAQAQVWKNQMSGSLKENERTPEFALKNAIDGAQVFQSMIEELQKISEGVGKISFANQ